MDVLTSWSDRFLFLLKTKIKLASPRNLVVFYHYGVQKGIGRDMIAE